MRIIGNRGNTARKVQAVASGALASGDTVVVNTDGTVSVISESTQSLGSLTVYESGDSAYNSAAFDSTNNKVVIAYRDAGNSYYGTVIVGTVSGTSISFGSAVVFNAANSSRMATVFDSSNSKIIIFYLADSAVSAIVGTVSSTSISFGSATVFVSNLSPQSFAAQFDILARKVVIAYGIGSNPAAVLEGTVSGTSISFASAVQIQSGNSDQFGSAFDSNSNKTVIAYSDSSNSGRGTSVVFGLAFSTLTSENFIGIASNGYATGQAATINAKGFVDDNQSSLTAGQSYFVQTNGDLGTTADDPSVFAGTAVSATKLIVKG